MPRKSNLPLPKNSSILFVTFSRWDKGVRTPTTGSLDPLRDFLVPKIRRLVIIDQPHPGSDRVMPVIEEFKNHKIKPKIHKSSKFLYLLNPLLKMFNVSKTQPIFKVRDFISVIDWTVRDDATFDYCICLESINTIAAIILRQFGRVKKVVYYVSDYSPSRYSNKLFNYIYLQMDLFCARNADYIWDVSPAMQKARIDEAGLDPAKSATAIHVPNGLYPGQIKANPLSKIDEHALVYMGTVTSDNGPDVAIKSLSIIKKKFKDAKLHIIGGTDKDFLWLERIIKKLSLEKDVFHHGFVASGFEMSKIIRGCAIGLAPYRDIPGSIRKYADAGKIRTYCASGLPVISSQVPPLGKVVEEFGAAIIAKDNPESFADAVGQIFRNKRLYMKLRKHAIIFGRDNTWSNSFNNAFKKM